MKCKSKFAQQQSLNNDFQIKPNHGANAVFRNPRGYLMQGLLIIGFCVITTLCFGQSQGSIDSLGNEICNSIDTSTSKVDSVKIFNAFNRHLPSFLAKYPKKEREEILSHIYFRLQRNCRSYWEILNNNAVQNKYWEALSSWPKSALNRNECREFLNYGKYKYFEVDGDSVKLEIDNGFWIDHFKDGTLSKLKFNWVNDCTFELVFIESNNKIRKEFSKPGDRYIYEILDKMPGYYDIAVKIPGANTMARFKLFY